MTDAKALGLISGTSMDGIDLAVLRTDGHRVLAFGPSKTLPYPADLRQRLLTVAADADLAANSKLADEDAAIVEAHAGAIKQFCEDKDVDLSAIDIVGFHGQTVLHAPERQLTRQLGDGAALAKAIGRPVIDRVRHADVAAGGQGAPFASLYHAALASDLERPLAILNLGGVGNVTYIDRSPGEDDQILAFDTGPASAMIDDWVMEHTGATFDKNGALASSGRVHRSVLEELMDNTYFAAPPPKSLDRNAFSAEPVRGLSSADGAATLTAFTVETVARALEHLARPPARWLVTGGGRHNATMMNGLAERLNVPVEPVEKVGWNGDAIEAQMMAFLAVRATMNLPLSLPTTTGVPYPMPGGRLNQPLAA
ncbi:MAG: anhydro-N-acetylmuramic acid kinase [Pseudomonadota bacterium]